MSIPPTDIYIGNDKSLIWSQAIFIIFRTNEET